MSKLTNFVTRPIAAAAAIAMLSLSLSSAQAAHVDVMTSNFDASSETFYAVSSTDLIEAGSATLLSQSTDPVGLGFGSSGANLNNGSAGTGGDLATTSALADSVWTATFELNPVGAPDGYDITEIRSYAGWNSIGNSDQSYELLFRIGVDPVFQSQGTFNFDETLAPIPVAGGSTEFVLGNSSGLIGTNVNAVRFVFPNVNASLTGVYRELDVFGVATTTVIPEPSSFALVAVGLVGMISRRKRNRC